MPHGGCKRFEVFEPSRFYLQASWHPCRQQLLACQTCPEIVEVDRLGSRPLPIGHQCEPTVDDPVQACPIVRVRAVRPQCLSWFPNACQVPIRPFVHDTVELPPDAFNHSLRREHHGVLIEEAYFVECPHEWGCNVPGVHKQTENARQGPVCSDALRNCEYAGVVVVRRLLRRPHRQPRERLLQDSHITHTRVHCEGIGNTFRVQLLRVEEHDPRPTIGSRFSEVLHQCSKACTLLRVGWDDSREERMLGLVA
mmetsp:Transcript_83424/g.268930  ORF Transcript_83424/g.268930 Transcript_83424/m.268930 type:complete len:253 (-) Transcript_83424:497-1255(-)